MDYKNKVSGIIGQYGVKDGYRTDRGIAPILVSDVSAERSLGVRTHFPAAIRPTDRVRKPRLHAPSTSSLDNKLLASLPRKDFDLLAPHLIVTSQPQGEVVYEAGAEVDYIYFPHGGMFSLLAVMRDGKAIETATVGREGVIGAMAGLGLYRSLVRAVVQLPLSASKIASSPFRRAVTSSDALRDLCVRYNEVMLTQARATAACNALHQVEERFCRWLLQSADRAGGDTLTLTQELLAEMLGVRRTSVTDVARKMQEKGVIVYSRGVIKILDRAALEHLSCECYETLIEQEATLA
jgi:CRP-like cAMP-binding protein